MQMDMRYEGQAHEIIVSVDPALSLDQIIENFEKNFEKSMVAAIRGGLLN